MWLSCSSFFQQFFHCYCPVGFGRRTDPNGDFIRRYLPILRGFPAKYIYDPWNAPESVQVAAKCVIGVHYPKPMVNHAESSRLNIERMRQIYQQLSRYRGLGLLASVPSTYGWGNRGIMAYSTGEQQTELQHQQQPELDQQQQHPELDQQQHPELHPHQQQHPELHHHQQQHPELDQQKQLHVPFERGYHSESDTAQVLSTGVLYYHEFAVPHSPGPLLHSGSSDTGKRSRESEQEVGGNDHLHFYSSKIQKQSAGMS
ncbi:hypothetical protein DPEC_G00016120 [Dallia pectoralis]|uniref:Uncharacterized protein n=1 Tax=Dallia pectoralis TaxID=75939 RepID=A0ACC2HP76_DALPE|nr:hypothetical protein DPEC_G00016120 [Dallia pectoralis]